MIDVAHDPRPCPHPLPPSPCVASITITMPSAHTSYTNGHAHHFTNGANGVNGATTKKATAQANTLLASFLDSHRELEAYKFVLVHCH